MKQGKTQQSFVKKTHWSQQMPSSNNTRDNSTHGHHQVVNAEVRLAMFFAAKNGEALQSQQKQDLELAGLRSLQQTRPGAGWAQLLIAKYQLKLKKVKEISRPFRYDLNQIPYDYTVVVTNRFKGLDVIACQENYGCKFVTLYRRQ